MERDDSGCRFAQQHASSYNLFDSSLSPERGHNSIVVSIPGTSQIRNGGNYEPTTISHRRLCGAGLFTAGHGRPTVSLSDFVGKQSLVVYFYPKDNTSGCTKEACSFRDLTPEFAKRGVAVIGVSTDSLKSHEGFAGKHELPFPLLADEDASMSTSYGAYREKSMYGRKYMGIVRSTFVIGEDGTVKAVFPNVKVPGHVERVLAAIDSDAGESGN